MLEGCRGALALLTILHIHVSTVRRMRSNWADLNCVTVEISPQGENAVWLQLCTSPFTAKIEELKPIENFNNFSRTMIISVMFFRELVGICDNASDCFRMF